MAINRRFLLGLCMRGGCMCALFLMTSLTAFSQSKLCTGVLGEPIISNDFGSGTATYNTSRLGFSTTFTLWNRAQTNDGYYSIVNRVPNDFQLQGTNVWHSGNDHTSNDGRGYMMLVNADEKLGQFYKDTVDNLCVGGTYEFSSYLANLFKPEDAFRNPVPSIPPKVRFEIRDLAGNLLDSVSTGNIENATALTWQKYGITFKSPSNSIVLVMVSTASRGTGNDIVLDDIVFRPCIPATISITPTVTVCEEGSGSFTVRIEGNADYKYSKWQVTRNGGKVWTYLGATILQTTNALNYNVDLPLTNIPVTDDSTLYRLVLSTSESNFTDAESPCNVISPVSLLRVNAYPILKITDPTATCMMAVDLTSTAITAGSTLGTSIVSYYRNQADATAGTNALSTAQAKTIATAGQYYIKASSNSTPACVDIKPVNISFSQPRSLSLSGTSPICKDNPIFTITATTVNVTNLVWTKSTSSTTLQSGTRTSLQVIPTASDLAKDSLYIKVTSNDVGTACPNITDSIKVVFYNAPTIVLPQDTAFCEGIPNLSLLIAAKVSNSPTSITWESTNPAFVLNTNTGVSTTLNLTNQTGSTLLIATATKSACTVRKDTMIISLRPVPVANAGADTSFCLGPNFIRSLPNNPLYSYKWSTSVSGVLKDSVSLTHQIQFIPTANTQVVLTISTSEGCTDTDNFLITAVASPTISLPNHLCFTTGISLSPVLSSTPMGGVFTWTKDNAVLSTSPTTSNLSVTQSGRYTFAYKDASCVASASTYITSPPVVTLANKQACVGSPVQLQANKIEKATYGWNGEIQSSQSTFNTSATSALQTVQLHVVDSLGCTSDISATVTGVPLPLFSLTSVGVCLGETGKIEATLADPNMENAYTLGYQWNFNGQSVASSSWKQAYFTESGLYSLDLSIGDCKVTKSISSVIFPLPIIETQEKYVYCNEEGASVLLQSNQSSRKQSWFLGNQLVGSQSQLAVHPDTNTAYLLMVEDVNSCRSSKPVFVDICCAPRLFIPNVITPSSNDVNSSLKVFGKYFTKFNLTVFSRWGEVIYSTKEHEQSWDGAYKSEAMPIGVYAWLVTYEGQCPDFKGPYKKVGEVTIIR